MSIRFLRHLEVPHHTSDVLVSADRDEATRRFDEVARPDQVVAAQIVVRLRESPRNREARDDPTFDALGFVDA